MISLLQRRAVMLAGGSEPTPAHDYSQDYLTLVALESGTFSFTICSGISTNYLTSISYSTDGGTTWTDTNNVTSETVTITTPTISQGGKVLWKGTGTILSNNGNDNNYSFFESTGNFNVEGNVMSLLFSDFAEKTLGKVFCKLFIGSKVVDASNLILPSTTMGNPGYFAMFKDCTALTYPPDLPATTLAGTCYKEMFSGCSALVSAPALPATTLATYCYQNMFSKCTSLTTAPVLPALTLKQSCYNMMFYKCTSLNYIKMMATDISASSCLASWVSNVAASGTFVKNASAEWTTTGASGVPDGWTVETASE